MSEQSSRQRTREQRAQRRRQAQTRLIVAVSVGAVVVVGAIVLLSVLSKPATQEVDEAFFADLDQSVDRSGALGYALGASNAPVTIVEYSDFSCTHCRDLSDIMHRIIDEYVREGRVRIVYKTVTFVNPPYSTPAAQAAICAAEQGRFWQMHDAIWSLYDIAGNPGSYSSSTLSQKAEELGLDMGQFDSCYSSPATQQIIQAVLDEARQLGIQGTPTVYVNGQQVGYTGKDTFYGNLVAAIEGQ